MTDSSFEATVQYNMDIEPKFKQYIKDHFKENKIKIHMLEPGLKEGMIIYF